MASLAGRGCLVCSMVRTNTGHHKSQFVPSNTHVQTHADRRAKNLVKLCNFLALTNNTSNALAVHYQVCTTTIAIPALSGVHHLWNSIDIFPMILPLMHWRWQAGMHYCIMHTIASGTTIRRGHGWLTSWSCPRERHEKWREKNLYQKIRNVLKSMQKKIRLSWIFSFNKIFSFWKQIYREPDSEMPISDTR